MRPCIHEVALGYYPAIATADGAIGPCVYCENERLRVALEGAAKCLDEVGYKWKDDAARARAALSGGNDG